MNLHGIALLTVSACLLTPLQTSKKPAPPIPQPKPNVPFGLILTQRNNNGVFQIEKGGTITFRLPSNPSTGFTWTVNNLNTTVFQMMGEPVYEKPNTKAVGAGGTLVFHFKAIAPQKSTLTLAYGRPWESKGKFTLALNVSVEVVDIKQ